MNNLSHLYEFRIVNTSNGTVHSTQPTRRRAAKSFVSLEKKGLSSNAQIQRKVNGSWQPDSDGHILAQKYAEAAKNGHTPAKAEKPFTLKSSLAHLSSVIRIVNSASTLTPEHEAALRDAMQLVERLLDGQPDSSEDTDEDDEDESDDEE